MGKVRNLRKPKAPRKLGFAKDIRILPGFDEIPEGIDEPLSSKLKADSKLGSKKRGSHPA